MNPLFAAIAETNRNYCAAHGMTKSAEVYDFALSQAIAEETRWLQVRNPSWSPIKCAKWAAVNVRDGVSNKPHAVIEYARNDKAMETAWGFYIEALGKYYGDARKRAAASGTVTFVGD